MSEVARIELLQPGLVLVTLHAGVDVGEREAEEIIAEIRALTPHQLHGNIVDIRAMTYMSREGRAAFAKADGALVVGVAVLVSNSVQRGLGNFYLTVLRPRVPTRLFDSQADAVLWLNGLLAKHTSQTTMHARIPA